MKNFRRCASLVACAFLAAGCVEFKAPLCSPELRVDIPNFEGNYEMKLFDPSSLSVRETQVQVIRAAKGDYQIGNSSGSGHAYVCQFDGRYFMESSAGSKSGNDQSYGIERRADGGFNLILYAADANALTAAGIPFEAIYDPQPAPSTSPDTLSRKILIDNVGLDSQKVFQLLDELGIRIAFQRTNSTGKDRKSSGKSAGSAP